MIATGLPGRHRPEIGYLVCRVSGGCAISMGYRKKFDIRAAASLGIGFAALFAASGCGTSAESAARGFDRISDTGTTLSITQFEDGGLKRSKTYDVAELPAAESAFLGYYRPPGDDPVQYELRFYPDHATAVIEGTSFAAEVSGKDALLKENDVTWKEGTRDRRGGGAFRDTITPLYADFAIFGNVILLCEGRDSQQSLGRCAELLRQIGATD